MLKRRLERLEGRQSPHPRHVWSVMWREVSDPFAAREDLLEEQRTRPLTESEAAELARLEAAIPNYQTDLSI
jgi:hypothetical protein